MAEILDANEIMFTNFEPKLKMRYIMYIDGIPSYIIKKAARPKITSETVTLPHINVERYVKGRSKWEKLFSSLY